jgi:hypothetical protein
MEFGFPLTDETELVDELEIAKFDIATLVNVACVLTACDEQFVAKGEVVIGCPLD